jgi:hypothetical protein
LHATAYAYENSFEKLKFVGQLPKKIFYQNSERKVQPLKFSEIIQNLSKSDKTAVTVKAGKLATRWNIFLKNLKI